MQQAAAEALVSFYQTPTSGTTITLAFLRVPSGVPLMATAKQ
jgi:hypothetical protein